MSCYRRINMTTAMGIVEAVEAVEAVESIETVAPMNRDATAQDATILAGLYHRLVRSNKDLRDALKSLGTGWEKGNDAIIPALRAIRDDAQLSLDVAMDESWDVLTVLPAGTVASGGATPQTIGLEFFNRNLNRGLKNRISAKDAKVINSRSFKG
jgi:hypothetical protein